MFKTGADRPTRRTSRKLKFLPLPGEPELDRGIVAAVKAFWSGNANSGQQTRVRDFILRELAGVGHDAFVRGEDGRRETDWNLGRQHVGLSLVNIAAVTVPPPQAGDDGIPRGREPRD